jgi:hypothetical protein
MSFLHRSAFVRARAPLFSFFSFCLLGSAALLDACDSDDTAATPSGTNDASSSSDAPPTSPEDGSAPVDGGKDASDAGSDGSANCPGEIKTGNGETCIGYGTGSTCDPQCGQPYGYVCANGPPPGFTGCREVSKSALGNSYCCPKNDCVAQPDQNAVCNDAGAGKTKRYQCPPGSTPPAGCVEHKSGGTNLEKLYCCP